MKFIKYKKDLPIDKERPYACLYWVYNKSLHTDPNTQGYIGVSAQSCSTRYKRHKRDSDKGSKLTVHKAMRKYGEDVTYMVLFRACPEFCLLAEGMLRPCKNTGWNTTAGGLTKIANSLTRGRQRRLKNGPKAPMTDATKLKISIAKTGVKQSAEAIEKRAVKLRGVKKNLSQEATQKESDYMKNRPVKDETKAKISAANKGRKHSDDMKRKMACLKNHCDWHSPNTESSNWLLAEQIYQNYVENPTHGEDRIARKFSKSPSSVRTILKKIRGGWNPLLDQDFQKWLSLQVSTTI